MNPSPSLTRRDFLAQAGATAATLTLPALARGVTAGARPPNILFLQSDDAGWQALGPYNPEVRWTPNLDRLAREGMTFDRCHCENSLCSPARAAMLTGKFSHVHGVLDNYTPFDGRQQTLPKLLQAAGYQTAMIGKWHLHSFPTGFDHSNVLDAQGVYYNCPWIENERRTLHPGYTDRNASRFGLEWLRGRDPRKPFFLIQSFKTAHRPWVPSPERLRSFEDAHFAEPPTLFDDYYGRSLATHGAEERIYDNLTEEDLKLSPASFPGGDRASWDAAYAGRRKEWERMRHVRGPELTRWKQRLHMLDYARMIATLDDEIGHFLRYLDEAGLAENTIVMFSSDHGMFLGEHGFFDKRLMYDEVFRVPCFIRWPAAVAPGSRCPALVQNVDYAPTLLEAAGAGIPGDVQGRSFLPFLRGETPSDWRRSLYYHFYEYGSDHRVFRHEGVATARHKLIHFYGQREHEFYDREADPHEVNNRFEDPACATALADLQSELQRLRTLYRVPPNGEMGWVQGRSMEMIRVNRSLQKYAPALNPMNS